MIAILFPDLAYGRRCRAKNYEFVFLRILRDLIPDPIHIRTKPLFIVEKKKYSNKFGKWGIMKLTPEIKFMLVKSPESSVVEHIECCNASDYRS